MNKEINEIDLIKGCINNDRAVQKRLYEAYASKMYAICLQYAKDKEAAQDILQDGFVKVFQKMKNYQSVGSLEGWIRRIITNTAIDYYRKYRKEYNFLKTDEYLNITGNDENPIDKINLKDILGFLKKLPEGARMVFNLYALEGYTHKEIAEKLEISEGTSKSQFSRARTLLQNWILSA